MTPTGFHYQPHRIHSRRAISLRCAGRPAGHRPHRCNSRLTLTTASAADSDGTVAKVEFYQGATLIGTATAPPYSVIWSNVANGSYSLTAVATDNQGVVTTSAAVPIIVSAAIAIYNIYPDQLGTPRLVTNARNQVVWRNLPTTEPFGNTPPEDDPNSTGNHFTFNLRFPGQYADKETNTNYNGFRDYDPSTGRYWQSDPIGLRGGINTYTYIGGNPLSYTDPFGLAPLPSQTPPTNPNPVSGPYNAPPTLADKLIDRGADLLVKNLTGLGGLVTKSPVALGVSLMAPATIGCGPGEECQSVPPNPLETAWKNRGNICRP